MKRSIDTIFDAEQDAVVEVHTRTRDRVLSSERVPLLHMFDHLNLFWQVLVELKRRLGVDHLQTTLLYDSDVNELGDHSRRGEEQNGRILNLRAAVRPNVLLLSFSTEGDVYGVLIHDAIPQTGFHGGQTWRYSVTFVEIPASRYGPLVMNITRVPATSTITFNERLGFYFVGSMSQNPLERYEPCVKIFFGVPQLWLGNEQPKSFVSGLTVFNRPDGDESTVYHRESNGRFSVHKTFDPVRLVALQFV